MTSDPKLTVSFEKAACQAACEAGELLRRRFRAKVRPRVEQKGLHDYVSEVDREAEEIVVGFLTRRFPDHAIMAEEGSPDAGGREFRWIVDPLDGTTNFIHGVPTFAVSVALEDASGLLAGAVHDPIREETFHARRGGGASLDGHPIRCSGARRLQDALIATGFPFRELSRLHGYLQAFERFVRVTPGIRRAGAAALDLAYTACGRYGGFFEVGLYPWDVAAGALLILEAGGYVTDVCGGDGYLCSGNVVAAGPGIHAAMLEITRATLA